MEVHEDDLLPDLRHVAVGDDEGVVRVGVEREAAHEVEHAHVPKLALVDGDAAPRTLGGVVGRAQDARALVQIGLQLGARPGVVAERDHVRARAEDQIRLLRRDAYHVRVFAVDDRERDVQFLLIGFQMLFQMIEAGLSADVAHRKNPDLHRNCSL